MDNYEKSLEGLKIKMYRLHFLLTEKQTKESIDETVEHFLVCFKQAFECMAIYFKNEHNLILQSTAEIIDTSFSHQLFNQQTIGLLHSMAKQCELPDSGNRNEAFINSIRDHYSRLLQMIYDMLVNMGKDPLGEQE